MIDKSKSLSISNGAHSEIRVLTGVSDSISPYFMWIVNLYSPFISKTNSTLMGPASF